MTNPASALRRFAAPAALVFLMAVGAPAWALTISGYVWDDRNGNAIIDDGFVVGTPGPTALANVAVRLYLQPAGNCDGNSFGGATQADIAITDVNGRYSFPSSGAVTLAPGCYSIVPEWDRRPGTLATPVPSPHDACIGANCLNTVYSPAFWGLTTRIDPYVVRLTKNTSTYTTAHFGFKDSGLQIVEHTAPNLVVDHNGYANLDGPEVFSIGTQVCNNTGSTINDVVATIGNVGAGSGGSFPVTTCTGTTCSVENGSHPSWSATSYGAPVNGVQQKFALQLVDTVNNSTPNTGDGCTTIPNRPYNPGAVVDPPVAPDLPVCATVDRSDAVRQLGDMAPGQCLGAYWAVKYELIDYNGNPLFGASNNNNDNLVYEWVVNVTGNNGAYTDQLIDNTTLRDEQKAASNKILPTGNNAGYVTVDTAPYVAPGTPYDGTAPYDVTAGQLVDVVFHNVNFGTIGAGFDANLDGKGDYDLWFQPIGESYIDPDKFRLLNAGGTFRAVCGGQTVQFQVIDSTYLTDIDRFNIDGASCSDANSSYAYRFIIIGPPEAGAPNPTISPYQEAASGSDNEKYNTDYCGDNPTGTPTMCVEFNVALGRPSVEKTVDVTRHELTDPVDLTYTLTYSNPATVTVGDPEANAIVMYDQIRERDYASLLSVPANCGLTGTNYPVPNGCKVQYSVDLEPVGSVTKAWTAVPPADLSTVNNLRFVLLDPVPGVGAGRPLPLGGTGSVSFTIRFDPDPGAPTPVYSGVYENIADIRIDGGDLIVQDNALTCIRVNVDCLTVTTVALVSGFGGYVPGGGSPVLWWETASEAGTVGFHLERRDPATGRFLRVNDGLLPGLLVVPQGGRYELPDPGVTAGQTHTYRLVEVENSGRENRYGPFTVTFVADGSTTNVVDGSRKGRAPAGFAKGFYSQAHEAPALHKARAEARRQAATTRKSARRQPGAASTASVASAAGSTYKLAVRDEGMYFVDLAALGLDPKRVSLTNKGSRIATWPANGGIYFYGTAIDSPYTLDNVYYLAPGKPLQMETVRTGQVRAGDTVAASFADKVHAEKDALPVTILTDDPSSDWWYQAMIVAGNPATQVEVPAHGAVAGQPARLAVNFQGLLETVSGNDQRARVSLNGTVLGEVAWDGATEKLAEFAVPAGLLRDGLNAVSIEGLLDAGVPYSVFFLDAIDLGYTRAFHAHEDRLLARSGDGAAVSIGGFSSGDVLVFDVTSASAPRVVTDAQAESGADGYSVRFRQVSGGSRYFATTRAAVPVLAPAGVDTPSNLKGSGGAQYVIIAPAEFRAAAQRLADYRANQGLSAMVVGIEDVYDEFNHGMASPQAIRDFFAHAVQNWAQKPRYGLLVGNGTFDHRDLLGAGDNIMPVWLAVTPNGLYAADNRFGDVSGDDGVPEVRMGRMPVLNSAELEAYVDRVIAWESASGDWTSRVLFAADKADQAGAFMADSDDIRGRLPAGYSASKIYLDNETIGVARSQLQQRWSEGRVFANYIGHGGTDRWSSQGLLTLGDAPGLASGSQRPIVASMTCSIGRFEAPGYTSLGEELVLSNAGGSIATWAPSGQSLNAEAKQLNEAFVDALFAGGGVRLGDAVRSALESYRSTGAHPYILDIYNLLGDPALQMKAPPAP